MTDQPLWAESPSDHALRDRVHDLESTLTAVQQDQVDAIVVNTDAGPRIYTLQGADQFYRALIEQMVDGATAVQTDGTILYANQALADLLRTPLQTLIGGNIIDYITAGDQQTVTAVLTQQLRDPQVPIRLRRNDSTPIHASMSARVVISDTTEPLMCLILSDRTQQRQAELQQRRADLASDRERVARDLHDLVIQQLYAAGLRLDRIVDQLPPDVEHEINSVIDDLDNTVRQIRATIFDLRTDTSPEDFERQLIALLDDAPAILGFPVDFESTGRLDRIPSAAYDDICATLREALSNAGRHAYATKVSVGLTVSAAHLTLRVADDGVGFTEVSRHSGLANMADRAESHDGAFEAISDVDGSGTTITWQIPLCTDNPAESQRPALVALNEVDSSGKQTASGGH